MTDICPEQLDAMKKAVDSVEDNAEPPTPTDSIYDAVEKGDEEKVREIVDAHPNIIWLKGGP